MSSKSKCCKICFDANRPGYDTHWMKDSSGNVLCPYLANLKCKRCGYTGHTIKYCKMPDNNKQYQESYKQEHYQPEKKQKNITLTVFPKNTNIFNLLCEDEDDNNVKDDDFVKCKESKQIIYNPASPDNLIVITDEEYFASPIIWGVGKKIIQDLQDQGYTWADIM